MSEHEHSYTPKTFLYFILRPFCWYVVAWVGVIVFWGIDISLKPYILKLILDSVAASAHNALIFPVFLYILSALATIMVGRFHSWLVFKITPKVKQSIAAFMLEKMLGHSYEVFQNQFSGALANKVNDVMNGVPIVLSAVMDGFLYHFLAFASASLMLWCIDYKYSLAMLVWIVTVLVVTVVAMKKSKELADESAESWSGVAGRIVDIFSNVLSIRFFSGKSHEYSRFNKALELAVNKEQNRNYFLLKIYAFQGISLIVLQVYCLFLLVKGVGSGSTTAGDFSLVISINTAIAECLFGISQYFVQFTEHIGKITQGLRAIITSKYEQEQKQTAQSELNISKGEIVFDNVSFKYKDGEPLFKNKTILIPGGQKLGLAGHSGSGKSTFVNLIFKLFELKSGNIKIDGQDIASISPESLSEKITLISQDSPLFHRTLMENICYGSPKATTEEVVAAAKMACAHDFIMELPNGYDTMVGERGVRFSSGQRQRIALTRAFLKNPSILILDEATSALDPIIEAKILNNIFEIMKSKTTIVIAHRLSTLTSLNKIFVFDNGKIVEEGNHKELLDIKGVYKKLWESQHGDVSQSKPHAAVAPEGISLSANA